ncbi:helix-turn-helix domain-containing protein [Spirochaeta thermophila]|uniref:Transcriptional regulator, XRE family n=1 Tax=Winmispira thermophila (strain ATCC 49972 / DSM 6192 / RI 19.B1) TaxID=665571 RepID=E0RR78_WINT6|nr:helix-turn-helix domain-containing protein [Spirochaeta thermophila]ADN03055.1 transcriptional regulator, XRE family [Spirochaeta thermophila DSM 6192]
MESLGAVLKNAREEKGISLYQAEKDTFILRRYLEALEAEDFSAFPGETYLMGFLKSYAEYLGLDPQRMVSLYRNIRLQEQEPPIEDLVGRPRSFPWWILLVVLLVIGVGVGGYFVFPRGGAAEAARVPRPSEAPQERGVRFQEEVMEGVFREGDAVVMRVGEEDHRFSFERFGAETLLVKTEEGEFPLERGASARLDVSGDGKPDLAVLVREIRRGEEGAEAVVRLDRHVEGPQVLVEGGQTREVAVEEVKEGVPLLAPIGSTLEEGRRLSSQVVLSADVQDIVMLELSFRGPVLFRSKVDDGEVVERFFQRGDVFRASMRQQAWLWLSNAGVVTARVGGVEMKLGEVGEVAVWLLTWVRNTENGSYHLELVPAY